MSKIFLIQSLIINNYALINVLINIRLDQKKIATYYGDIGVGKGLDEDRKVKY